MKYKVIILFLALIFIIGCSNQNQIETEEEKCNKEKGEWKTFPTPCSTDECKWILEPAEMCIQVIAESCDCGIDKCWNGEKCIPNPK